MAADATAATLLRPAFLALHAAESITEIAYAMGFSSSSHFSNLFRAQFSLRPSDVRGTAVAPGLARKTSLLTEGVESSRRGVE